MIGFTYRGRHSGDLGLVVRTNPSLLPEFENSYISVPGAHGSIPTGTKYISKTIQLEVGFVENNLLSYSDKLRLLAQWLDPTNGDGELVMDHEPNKTYFARLDEASFSRIENISRMGKGLITFKCGDPFAYGPTKTESISSGSVLITNEGTADTSPIFEIDVDRPIAKLEITNHSSLTPYSTPRSVILGMPYTPAETPVQREELVFNDTMRDTSSWQTATEVDNGHIAGEMGIDTYGFIPETVGQVVNAKQWQGPSLVRAIGTSLQDFRADIYVRLMNKTGETGMIEVYFRDANGNKVAKMVFADPWVNQVENQWQVMIGSFNTFERAAKPEGWNDFYGIMRIEREGNLWTPYIARIRNGVHEWKRSTVSYTDVNNQSMARITQIQVSMRIFPLSKKIPMAVQKIHIFKINPTKAVSAPKYLAMGGDKIVIDCGKGTVTINGELYLGVDLNTEFFSLIEGFNRISVSPYMTTSMKYKERYI